MTNGSVHVGQNFQVGSPLLPSPLQTEPPPGLVSPLILERLMAYQTQNWAKIAQNFFALVCKRILEFHIYLVEQLCTDAKVCHQIKNHLDPFFLAVFNRAESDLAAILTDECTGHLLTTNHYLADNLQASRADRFAAGLRRAGFVDGQVHAAPINFSQMTSGMHLSNEKSAVIEIHDNLRAYYRVALKRFIDNVAVQVIERVLLGSQGPVRIFTSEFVVGLADEVREKIAGEEEETADRRAELEAQLTRLEGARKICAGKIS